MRYYALLLLITSWFVTASSVADQPDVEWRKIANGVDLARVRVSSSSFLSPELLLIRIDSSLYRFSAIRGIDYGLANDDIKKIASVSKALIGINANFFDENGRPLGLVMSHGIAHHGIHQGGKTLTGIFQVTRNGVAIVNRINFSAKNAIEAIQAGPRLIDQSKAIKGQKGASVSSRRAGICIHQDQKVSLYISSGFTGVTISQVQDVLQHPEINCKEALNLDGGGSAQLFVSDKLPGADSDLSEIVIHGRDDVPVILGVYPKP